MFLTTKIYKLNFKKKLLIIKKIIVLETRHGCIFMNIGNVI